MFEYVLVLLVLLFGVTSAYLLYERYSRRTKRSETTPYVEALRDLLDGKQESAFTKLRQVVIDDSNNIDAYLRLGQILREYNRPDRALQVHKDLTLRAGLARAEKTAILRQLVLDYIAVRELPTAEAALEELISLDPQDHWAHRELLELQTKAQKWDDAYDTAVHLLKLQSNKSKKPLAQYKYFAGLQMYKRREYHKARILFKEAIGLDPTYVQAYLAIGDSYYEEKRLEDAVNYWNKLIAAEPAQGRLVIERLKKTLFELGRFGEIMEICRNILEHDPKNIDARRMLAEFYEKKGETHLAVELLEQIVDDYPDDLTTVVALIRYYEEKDDTKKLDELLRTLERRQEAQSKLQYERTSDSSPVGTQR
jgi:lipopolysaccharide biosynthesis regulator YciM